MKALVTGATGFLGTAICNRLVRDGHHVIGMDDLSASSPDGLLPEVEFIKTDITSKADLWQPLRDADCVFHLAAKVIVPDSLLYPSEYERVNVGGTVTLLEAMHDVGNKRLVFSSSGAIYGLQNNQPLLETHKPAPESPYAVSKLASEYYIKTIGQLWGLKAVCLRVFNAYGPRQSFSFTYAPVVPAFLRQCAVKGTIIIHGDGNRTRDFVYIDDVVEAFISASCLNETDEAVINIGSGVETSVNQVLYLAQTITDGHPEVVYNQRRIGGPDRMCADIALAKEKLNYTPKVMLEEGMRRTFELDLRLQK